MNQSISGIYNLIKKYFWLFFTLSRMTWIESKNDSRDDLTGDVFKFHGIILLSEYCPSSSGVYFLYYYQYLYYELNQQPTHPFDQNIS